MISAITSWKSADPMSCLLRRESSVWERKKRLYSRLSTLSKAKMTIIVLSISDGKKSKRSPRIENIIPLRKR